MTDSDPREHMAEGLRSALAALGDLHDEDRESVSSLIAAGELELALDTLCTQIFEYDVDMDDQTRGSLMELGDKSGVPVSYLLGDPWAIKPDKPWY